MAVKKNILYLADGGMYSGGQRIMQTLLEDINANKYRKFIVSLYNSRKETDVLKTKLIQNDFSIESVPLQSIFDFGTVMKIVRICKKWNIHLIHTDSRRTDIIGCIASKLIGIPIVSTCHAVIATCTREKILQKIQLFCYRFFDKIIVPSNYTKYFITGGREQGNICTIYNGIRIPKPNPILEDEIGLKLLSPYVIYVGTISDEKGLNYLLEAFSQIVSKIRRINLVIVGQGPQTIKFKNRVRDLNLGNSVFFVGFQEDIESYIYCSEFLVHPSLSETFSLVLLEAMALGKSVIATRVGGIPEIVKNGINGLLVKPRNSGQLVRAMINLLEDETKRKRMGEAGRNLFLQNFASEKMVHGTEAIYSKILDY